MGKVEGERYLARIRIDAPAIQIGSSSKVLFNAALYFLLVRMSEFFWKLQGFFPTRCQPVKGIPLGMQKRLLLHKEKRIVIKKFCYCQPFSKVVRGNTREAT